MRTAYSCRYQEHEIMDDLMLTCPQCGSEEVTVSHKQRFMANTGEHYCHSVKTQDANSEATCLACEWVGRRDQLKGCVDETV